LFDLALKNGIIADGTRSEPYKGNVYIKNGKIGLIDSHNSFGSKKVLDCSGNVISPGFIDIHTHIDACPLNKKEKQSLLNEGTTFALGGNCGISLIPSNDESRKGIQDFFNRTVEIVPEDKNLKIRIILSLPRASRYQLITHYWLDTGPLGLLSWVLRIGNQQKTNWKK